MRLGTLIHLHRVRLRRRAVQELLAVAGIAVGVALLFAAQVAGSSLSGSVRDLAHGVAGRARLQLAARGPAGVSADLAGATEHLPGVLVAAPVLDARVTVEGPRGRSAVDLIGADPRLARLGGTMVRRSLTAASGGRGTLVLPSAVAGAVGARAGSQVSVETSGTPTAVTVGAVLNARAIGDLSSSPVAIAALPVAQALAGLPGRISRVLVEPAPGRDRQVAAELRRVAGPQLAVEPSDFDARAFATAARPTDQSTSLFAAFSALVGFLFATTATLLTLPQRTRLVADLRLAGHDAGTVVQVLAFDALVLGLAGVAAGLGLGHLIAGGGLTAVPQYLTFAFAVGSPRIVTWQDVAIAAAGGLVAAAAAVLVPLRSVLTARPTPNPPPRTGRQRTRLLAGAGLALLIAAVGIGALAPASALVAMACLGGALLASVPLVLDLAVNAFAAVRRRAAAATPLLAVAELRSTTSRGRSLGVAATAAVAVFASVAIEGAQADLQHGLDRSSHDLASMGQLWVGPGDTRNLLDTTPFAPSVARRLARLPAVATVSPWRSSFLDVGTRRVWVIAPPPTTSHPIPPTQLLDGDVATATRRLDAGGWAVLSRAVAADLHAHVGQRFVLPSPVPAHLRLAAISTNIGWAPGAVILNGNDDARAWGDAHPTALLVRLRGGVPPAAGASAIRQALGPRSGMLVETAATREARQRRASRQGLARLSAIALLVLLAAILATVTAMAAMIWQRRRQLAALKLDGLRETTLWRALLVETALLLGAGCVPGALFGLLGQTLLSRALANVTGFPVVQQIQAGTAIRDAFVVLAVAVACVAVPGRLAAAVAPAVGLED